MVYLIGPLTSHYGNRERDFFFNPLALLLRSPVVVLFYSLFFQHETVCVWQRYEVMIRWSGCEELGSFVMLFCFFFLLYFCSCFVAAVVGCVFWQHNARFWEILVPLREKCRLVLWHDWCPFFLQCRTMRGLFGERVFFLGFFITLRLYELE